MYDYLIKMGYFEVACCGQKSQCNMVWYSEILATLGEDCQNVLSISVKSLKGKVNNWDIFSVSKGSHLLFIRDWARLLNIHVMLL